MMTKSKQIECFIREMIGTAAMRENDEVIEDCVRLMEILSQVTIEDLDSLRGIEERIKRTCKHIN